MIGGCFVTAGSGLGSTALLFARLNPSCIAKCFAQQELDLTVQTAQIIIRPPLQIAQDLGINPYEKRLSFRHNY